MANNIKSLYEISEPLKINAFYSFFKVHYKTDFRFDGEIHNFWECVYVMDGGLQVSADNRVYNLSGGDIIFHKPMEMHKFTVTPPMVQHFLFFHTICRARHQNYLKTMCFPLMTRKNTFSAIYSIS